jgi:hypothetical protein
VPGLRGDSLAAAYTRLADLGVPRGHRSSQDVSGQGRTVLQPNNWLVCTQRPAAGTRASAQTVYQFGVVKFGERCPSR